MPLEGIKGEDNNIQRHGMKTSHKETDDILMQQIVFVAKKTLTGVSLISDDTDVFVLALYHAEEQQLVL